MVEKLRVEAAEIGRSGRVSEDFLRQLAGWGLTTAEILYRMPDHPSVLQSFIWQEYDAAPHFPMLKKFLTFWREKLDGPLHSVRIGHERLIRPAEIRALGAEFRLH
ncbi:MAG: usg protein [Rhodoblastus sp.]